MLIISRLDYSYGLVVVLVLVLVFYGVIGDIVYRKYDWYTNRDIKNSIYSLETLRICIGIVIRYIGVQMRVFLFISYSLSCLNLDYYRNHLIILQ